MPRIATSTSTSTSTPASSFSPAPTENGPTEAEPSELNVSVIHLSVAKKLAAGRSYQGVPPLGPLALPYYISYAIVDDSPRLPLEIKPNELYATVGGPGELRLKKIRLIANCEEGRIWKKTAEKFQSGNKQGTIPAAARIKVEVDEHVEMEVEHELKKFKRYGSLRGAGTNSNPLVLFDTSETKKIIKKSSPPPDLPEIKKRRIKSSKSLVLPDPPETKKRRIKNPNPIVFRNPPETKRGIKSSSSPAAPDLVLPDLTPEEVESRRVEATMKNEALKRGLGLKSLSFHEAESYHHYKTESHHHYEMKSSYHRYEMVDKQTQTEAVLSGPKSRKIAEFTERLVVLVKILHKAIEVLPESYLLQIEGYFEVDWMVEDIEAAVKGAISRKNLADGVKKDYKSLFTVADTCRLPSALKNQKITEFAVRLMSLVKTLYQAIEVLSEPYLMELERLFDVDWMIEDIGGAVGGAISCKNLNGAKGESCW